MKEFLHHLFLPRPSNNYRAKLLHHQVLLTIVLFFFFSALLLPFIRTTFPEVLGIATDISSDQLLTLTNQKRQQAGVGFLRINNELSQAAYQKAKDMFAKDYWAHNAPDGTTPWVFIKNVGYEYTYAGENLARGFSTSPAVIEAWMASQSHKENMLSSNYEEVGFAVVPGKLKGEDTILIVEMFGGKTSHAISQKPAKQPAELVSSKASKVNAASAKSNLASAQNLMASLTFAPLLSSDKVSKSIGVFAIAFLLSVFTVDMIIAGRKKVVRFVGYNLDHILFLSAIFIFVLISSRAIIV